MTDSPRPATELSKPRIEVARFQLRDQAAQFGLLSGASLSLSHGSVQLSVIICHLDSAQLNELSSCDVCARLSVLDSIYCQFLLG